MNPRSKLIRLKPPAIQEVMGEGQGPIPRRAGGRRVPPWLHASETARANGFEELAGRAEPSRRETLLAYKQPGP